ncbi:helix-turn-helix transcriptional regulator [Listeria rocourtiae]|uniref:helix-turn-helix domain-containing protein n=1 Tax=Listeria rocourtiae TaxID=647910 RepID=UPI001625C894|nr:helix-turn-helix transcriptional regulator [Listeria rocourtiae]MBC1604419.1 helix-turn-helix transcriptional regulator [Listeria rocourtiae]
MTLTIGDTLKYIRSNKQYSQNKICINTLSRTALSKIENNKLSPTYTKLSYIVEKLDLDFKEFHYVQNNFSLQGKNLIINNFKLLSNNTEIDALKQLMALCDEYLATEPEDYIIKDILLVLQSLIMLHDGLPIENIVLNVSPVWERISRLDKWFLIEIYLINNILFTFDTSSAMPICIRLLEELEKYKALVNKPINISLQLNLAFMLLSEGNKHQAITYLNQAIILSRQLKRYDLLAVSQVRLGLASTPLNVSLINKGLSIISTIELADLEIQVKKEICIFTCPIKK